MAGRCAGCLGSIDQGEKFSLVETEVFHRQCVSQAARSVLTRTKIALARARADGQRAVEADALRARMRELEVENDEWRRDRNAQYGRAEQAITEARRLSQLATNYSAEAERALSEKRSANDDIVRLERELSDMRGHLRQLQEQVTPPKQADPKKQQEDAAVVRFGLLELDLPK